MMPRNRRIIRSAAAFAVLLLAAGRADAAVDDAPVSVPVGQPLTCVAHADRIERQRQDNIDRQIRGRPHIPFDVEKLQAARDVCHGEAASDPEDMTVVVAFGKVLLARGEFSRAASYLGRAVDAGDEATAFFLALAYENGGIGGKDLRDALPFFQMAADAGSIDAQTRLGRIYAQGRQDFGIAPDLDRARTYLGRAADRGNLIAKFYLADLHAHPGAVQDLDKAARLMEEAADGGMVRAKIVLSNVYLQGLGVERDLEKGVRLLQEAAAAGHPQARQRLPALYIRLGDHFMFGWDDLPQDESRARRWYCAAGEQGARAYRDLRQTDLVCD